MAFRSDNHKKIEITVFSSPAEKMRIILFSVNDTDISRKKNRVFPTGVSVLNSSPAFCTVSVR